MCRGYSLHQEGRAERDTRIPTKPDPRSVPMAPGNPPALVTVPVDTDFSRGIAPTPGAYGHRLLLMTFLIAFRKEKNIQAQKQIKITSHIFVSRALRLPKPDLGVSLGIARPDHPPSSDMVVPHPVLLTPLQQVEPTWCIILTKGTLRNVEVPVKQGGREAQWERAAYSSDL